jgi:uncharacterized protein YacL (UPF0231 family)
MTDRTREECLEQFIKTFRGSLDARLWIKLVKEELAEAQAEEVGTVAHLKEIADLQYVIEGFDLVAPDALLSLTSTEELDQWEYLMIESDETLKYAMNYYGNEALDEAFMRVHLSNMSKLGEDGKPIFREDGKVLKGPNYKAPDLTDLP